MQMTPIHKFSLSSEVVRKEQLVPWLAEWPNWHHEQLLPILLVKGRRRILDPKYS
jgi:hypothetical protein